MKAEAPAFLWPGYSLDSRLKGGQKRGFLKNGKDFLVAAIILITMALYSSVSPLKKAANGAACHKILSGPLCVLCGFLQ